MNHRELEMHLTKLFEGRLQGDELEALQQELRANPEARLAYRDHARLQNVLQVRAEGNDTLQVIPMDRVVERQQQRAIRNAGFAAVAVLVLFGILMLFILIRTPPPVLTFATSPGSTFSLSSLAGEEISNKAVLEPGSRLEVVNGTVELSFASGVRGIVRGPTELTLLEDDLLHMARGTGWFQVPEEAIGFKVITPDLLITDLGTEFGVLSQPDILDAVHVFTGKVEVVNRYGLKRREMITAGQAREAGPAGRWKEINCQMTPFLTELPTKKPEFAKVIFSDSFDTDSSEDYICFDYYRNGGLAPDAFSIDEESDGVLEVTGGSHQVIHRTATLGVGEVFKVDWLTPVVSGSASQVLTDAHLQTRYSVRLRVTEGVFDIDFRNGFTGSYRWFDNIPFTAPETFWVERMSATEFAWYRGVAVDSLTKIAEVEFDSDPGKLYIGLQAYAMATRFDNLSVIGVDSDFRDAARPNPPREDDDR